MSPVILDLLAKSAAALGSMSDAQGALADQGINVSVTRISTAVRAVAFRRSVLVDSEIEFFDLADMKAKVFQNRTQTGFPSVFDDAVDGAITIVTQTGIGRPMDIRFNNGAVAANVIEIDFFFGDHSSRKKLVERLPRFGLECKIDP
jgi:hypothetical protein